MAQRKGQSFNLEPLDDFFKTDEERKEDKLSKIRDIPIDMIDDFPDHPFKVRDDEDMKSVQGDSGHAQVKMVADVYSHIIDDDRRLNAERMEAAFYSGRQATPEPVQPAATESSADDKELLLKLLQNPEMAALLKSLAKTL